MPNARTTAVVLSNDSSTIRGRFEAATVTSILAMAVVVALGPPFVYTEPEDELQLPRKSPVRVFAMGFVVFAVVLVLDIVHGRAR